ncbi:type VI secretion system membrane subunit TssM [Noviherbaspirillum denitrificans]|uniref:Type VI secretion protein n=1 Tax=Noviherbaspirillum denitrificans TaxID=1968433 RepID=A0A254TAF5_9BURK|nr:type VI secretion system membrane subunit TssM [Noviherbaspirillum denitrificans]OWW19614.1 type VI secretion protein [Noviherbaspirillum denitrificans]
MWKWLRNGKIASAFGFLILIALIWIAGPYVGLVSRDARFASIFGVMLLWVVTLMAGRLLAERAGGVLEKVLRGQADDAVMGASPESRAEVTRLRQRMLAAIDTLKTSKLGKARGKAALYELPWYMIIGHPAAGKSSAILHSGLTFPFGDKHAVQGVGGTRDCDWFFSTEGVLLDTAGRYATQREDRGEWLMFLKLLKKYRRKAPVNGILVAVSFPELVQFRSEQFALYARQVRERINEIDDAFGIKVPIYLVFTKIDLLGGFAQFFDEFTEDERQQVWGATLSHDQGSEFDAKRAVCQQFDELYRGLVQIGNEKLALTRENAARPALFAFPIEFNAMRDAIGKFVELLFQDDPYHAKPLLRGFYFTSALQEGAPRISAGTRVAQQFDLAKPGFDAAHPPSSNSFFLRNLFREVLFPDQHLITRQLKTGNTRLRVAGIAGGLALLAFITAGLTWSYIGNQKLIASAEEELLAARELARSAELTDKLKALQVLQLRIERLYAYRKDGHPFSLGMSLYQGQKLERILRAEYFDGVRSLMLGPVTASLESTLAALGGNAVLRSPMPKAEAVEKPSPVDETLPGPAKARKKREPAEGLPVIPLAHAPVRIVRVGASDREALAAARGAQAAARSAAAPTLEDGYNALKTYLMLEDKERMDASHLSDQIPRYWRSWLEANRGKGNLEEINRLAERVVAFYVSQMAEPDLPLIDNRAEIVAAGRDVLRSAIHRMPAKERVYNELKARANTQFAPVTVGRILNNPSTTVLAGSYAVPGAFTREAWDKYFRASITEASKGEVRGDDWVLAASTVDNLGRDGNAERTRTELESMYKEEFAREWKKFLQGLAIQEFGNLESAAQGLGFLADTQASAIRQVLARAASETAWDNPSQLTASIQSAKSSVVERTEKLILGSSNAQASVSGAPKYGELGARFAGVAGLVAIQEGGRAPISAYLEALAKLKSRIAQMASNGEPDAAARQLVHATLTGSASELVDTLALVDGALLSNQSEETREIVRPLLVRPLVQTFAALVPPVERDINRAWQSEVLPQWRSLANKYPFADSANEAAMGDIAKFLKPGEGTLPKFMDKHLAGLTVKRGEAWTGRTWANIGVGFNPAFLGGVTRLMSIGSAVLLEGDSAKFEMQPVPTPGLKEITLEIDGQLLTYRNGPQPWTAFTWPNPANTGAQAARIQAVSVAGVATSVASFNGRLSLMRLLAQARTDNPSSPTIVLEWRFKKERAPSEQEPAAARTDTDTDAVRFHFRMVNGTNPLALSGLRRVALPEKITN